MTVSSYNELRVCVCVFVMEIPWEIADIGAWVFFRVSFLSGCAGPCM